jgi:hypothetical protein
MQTQPVKYIYNGRAFPSDLEARWAVFLDALDAPYEYEARAFDLPYGGSFTPDFWLPNQRSWIDISPGLPDEHNLVRAADLSFATRQFVYVLWGTIGEHRIYTFSLPFYEQGYDKRYVLSICSRCRQLIIVTPLRGEDAYQFMGNCSICGDIIMQKSRDITENTQLNNAYTRARAATFEQTPTSRHP